PCTWVACTGRVDAGTASGRWPEAAALPGARVRAQVPCWPAAPVSTRAAGQWHGVLLLSSRPTVGASTAAGLGHLRKVSESVRLTDTPAAAACQDSRRIVSLRLRRGCQSRLNLHRRPGGAMGELGAVRVTGAGTR